MNLRSLSRSDLLSQTTNAIKEERLSTLKVLHYFRELERRREFLGHSSLFDVAVKHFGYSSAAAQRRIQAMRLLKELPEFETKIESGELTLTAAASAQSYFKRSAVRRSEKVELLQTCLKKSSREVEKEIAKREPLADKRADIRYSNGERLRMSLNISEQLFQKLEKLKYQMGCASIEQVIEKLADQAAGSVVQASKKTLPQNSLPAPEVKARHTNRHIPSVTKRIVIKNSQPKCAYTNPRTGENCTATDKLEFDHITPFSQGGPHLAENLRRLCSHHNKLVWREEQRE